MDLRKIAIDIDAFLDPVLILDPGGYVVRASASSRVVLRTDPADLVGTSLAALMTPPDKPRLQTRLDEMARTRRPDRLDLHLAGADRDAPVRLDLAPIAADGVLHGFQAQLRENRDTEKLTRIREERERNAATIEEISEIMNSISGLVPSMEAILRTLFKLDDFEYGALYCTREGEPLRKVTEANAFDNDRQVRLPEVLDEDDLPEDFADFPRQLNRFNVSPAPRVMRTLGERGLGNAVIVPIRCYGDLKGTLVLAGGGAPREIDPIKHTLLTHGADFIAQFIRAQHLQEEVVLHRNRFRDLIESSVDHIWETGRDGRYVYNSPSIRQVYGYEPDEAKGRRPVEFIHPDDQPEIERVIEDLTARKEPLRGMVYRILDAEGKVIFVESRAFPIFDENGDVAGYRGVERNISDWFEKQHILEETLAGTCEALSRMVELRDPYTKGHSTRVAELMVFIGRKLGRSPYELQGLRLMGLLHDIGKIGIPTEILSKPGKLSPEEMELMRHHPRMSHDILKDISFPWPVAQVVLQHHERLNGSGYPQGLDGDEIMWQVRLLAVADLLEAMSTDRPYRPGLGIARALQELELGRDVLFDGEIVDAVTRLHVSGELAPYLANGKHVCNLRTDGAAGEVPAPTLDVDLAGKPMPDAEAEEAEASLGELIPELGGD